MLIFLSFFFSVVPFHLRYDLLLTAHGFNCRAAFLLFGVGGFFLFSIPPFRKLKCAQNLNCCCMLLGAQDEEKMVRRRTMAMGMGMRVGQGEGGV